MGAKQVVKQPRKGPYDVTQYQTTHLCGGAIMGTDPTTSALNRYLQSWDVPNLFVMGASAFPQNAGYNPTGTRRGAGLLVGRGDPDPVSQEPGAARPCLSTSALRIASVAIAVVRRGVEPRLRLGAADGAKSGRASTRRISARSSGGAISPSPATARVATLRPGQVSPSPAAGRSRRRSASCVGANITPDPETGIGAWSDEEFVRALREGKGRDGQLLYPAMPYPYYTKLTESDALAIRAYLNTVKPVHNAVVSNKLPFPFDVREGMAAWNALYFRNGEFKPDPTKSAEWNRGAYLVEGLGIAAPAIRPRRRLAATSAAARFRARAAGMVRAQHH